jgi:hypothetical protein
VFASQSELEAAESDNDFGISQGISLAELESAERYMYNMPRTPPPLNLEDTKLLNTDALLDSDKVLVTKFYREIAKIHVDTCNTCNRTWFGLDVFNSECSDCLDDRMKNSTTEGFVPLFGRLNNLDPGPMPPELPTLSPIEEMLLARVHIFMEVRQHRGLQYKYRGHICNFSVNTAKVFDRLPLLPSHLDIIILKPPPSPDDDPEAVNRQFRKDYKVRRAVVMQWLLFLTANHPGYSDILINTSTLNALPEDDYVDNQLTTIVRDPSIPVVQSQQSSPARSSSNPWDPSPSPAQDSEFGRSSSYGASVWDDLNAEDDLPPEVVVVPDMLSDLTEFDALRQQMQSNTRENFLSMGSIRRTPIADLDAKERCLSLAFPSLYPTGLAEFVQPRLRDISYHSYVKLMLCYRDGRFARHPRFRYAAFNTIMRRQLQEKVGFFVKRYAGREEMTLEEIRAAFDGDDGGQQLIDSVVRWSATVRGTRAFWTTEGKKLEAMVRI